MNEKNVLMQSHQPQTVTIRPYQHAWQAATYLVISVLGLATGIFFTLRDGGARMSIGRTRPDHNQAMWVPMPYAIPIALAVALPIIALLVYAVVISLRIRITMTEVGIIETDSTGKEILRAKWEEVVEVSQNKGTKVNIVTVRGVARIDKRHRRFASAMAMVKEHTGKALS